MGREKENTPIPALYAVDPDWLLDAMVDRMKKEGLVIKVEPDKWLTIAQVSVALNFSKDHIRRLIDDGILPAEDFRSGGSTQSEWRVLESNLKNLKR